MPSTDVCFPNAASMVHIYGELAELDDGLPGGVKISCCVFFQRNSVDLLVGWHTIFPSGIIDCGIETFCSENRARRLLIIVWRGGVAIIWDPDLV